MERIQGLKEYVQTEHYLEGIGIGKEEQKEIQITYQPLAQGEYQLLVRTPTDRKETGASCQYRKPDASGKSD